MPLPPNLLDPIGGAIVHETDDVAGLHRSVENAAVDDRSAEGVVLGVKNECSERLLSIASRRRDASHYSLKDLLDADPLLGGTLQMSIRVQSQLRVDLFDDPLNIR